MKTFKAILATLIITTLLIFLRVDKNSLTESINLENRSLQDANPTDTTTTTTVNSVSVFTLSDYQDLCTTSNNSTLGYAQKFQGISNTLAGYISNYTGYKSDENSNLYNAIVNSDNGAATSFVKDVLAPYIVFLVFAAITILTKNNLYSQTSNFFVQ